MKAYCEKVTEVYICGGGVHNSALMTRLSELLADTKINSTEALGIKPDDVEAVTFAWLAMRTMEGLSGNQPSVTGANKDVVLGAIYPA